MELKIGDYVMNTFSGSIFQVTEGMKSNKYLILLQKIGLKLYHDNDWIADLNEDSTIASLQLEF